MNMNENEIVKFHPRTVSKIAFLIAVVGGGVCGLAAHFGSIMLAILGIVMLGSGAYVFGVVSATLVIAKALFGGGIGVVKSGKIKFPQGDEFAVNSKENDLFEQIKRGGKSKDNDRLH